MRVDSGYMLASYTVPSKRSRGINEIRPKTMSAVSPQTASSSTLTAVYLWAGDEIVANITSGYYYFHDGRGNVSHLSNSSNVLIERYTYDLNGTVSYFDRNGSPMTTSSVGNRFLFEGAILLPEVNLYDMRNRIYFPHWGRFLQTDPIGFKGDADNLYRYCDNDPADRTDPTGLTGSTIEERMSLFYGDSSQRGSLFDLDHPKQSSTRDMAGVAEDMAISNPMRYHNTRNWYFKEVDHCNELPGDAAEASGRVRPMVAVPTFLHDNDPAVRGAVSHELADPKVKIPHWSEPRPLSEARRNDIIAQQHGRGGHTGIVTGPGRTISVDTTPENRGRIMPGNWGFRPWNGEGPKDPPPVVRHYIAGSGGEW